jgi:hypothetical protein
MQIAAGRLHCERKSIVKVNKKSLQQPGLHHRTALVSLIYNKCSNISLWLADWAAAAAAARVSRIYSLFLRKHTAGQQSTTVAVRKGRLLLSLSGVAGSPIAVG